MSPEHLAKKEYEVKTVLMVNQEATEKMVPQVLPVNVDHEDQLENKAQPDSKV